MPTPDTSKSYAVIAYITILGTFIALLMSQGESSTSLVRFHIRQALGLHLMNFLLMALANLFPVFAIGWAFFSAYLILLIYGMLGAFQKEHRTVPLVGAFFQRIFTFI